VEEAYCAERSSSVRKEAKKEGVLSVIDEPTGRHEVLDARVRLPQGVVYRSFVKETVILNLDTGLYHGLNTTAGRMLAVLEEVGSVRQAAAQLAKEYGRPKGEIEADITEFCDALIERSLLEIVPAR
jgi:hypothetical protein